MLLYLLYTNEGDTMTQTHYNLCIKNLTDWIIEQERVGEPEDIFEAYQARDEWIAKNKVSERVRVRECGYGTNGEYWEE